VAHTAPQQASELSQSSPAYEQEEGGAAVKHLPFSQREEQQSICSAQASPIGEQ
jgi:hypothetical protein